MGFIVTDFIKVEGFRQEWIIIFKFWNYHSKQVLRFPPPTRNDITIYEPSQQLFLRYLKHPSCIGSAVKSTNRPKFKESVWDGFSVDNKGEWSLLSLPLALPSVTVSLDEEEMRPHTAPPPLLHLCPGCPSGGTQQQVLNELTQVMRTG